MAKKNADSGHTENEVPVAAEAPAVVNATQVSDDRYVTLTTDGQYGTTSGATVKRIDLIRALWQQQKMSRGAIAKYLSQLKGQKIPYQIVFSGTKGLAGGPDKVAAVQSAPTQAS